MDISSLVGVRRRAILIIIGSLFTGVLVILSLGRLSIGFPWSIVFERLWLVLSIVLGLILAGYIYLYFRLSVLHHLAIAITRDQPLPKDMVRSGFKMIYSLPAAMALTAPALLVLGTLVHSLDLWLSFEFPLQAVLLLIVTSIMVFCFCASVIFFSLKREFRPLFMEIFSRISHKELEELDRSWDIPGWKKVSFRIPVRAKIFFGAFTLAVVGFWFCLLGYNLGIRFLEEHYVEAGRVHSSAVDQVRALRAKWLVLLIAQAGITIGLAALLARLIGRDIIIPLASLGYSENRGASSSGDAASMLSEDEIGEMIQSWDQSIKSIHVTAQKKLDEAVSMMSGLGQSIRNLEDGSIKISELFEKQTEDATTQVAMISEVSASSQQLSTTAGSIARHAEQIKQVAEMAQGEGDAGVDFVSRMIQQMEELRSSTGAIKKDLERFQEHTRQIHGILEIIEEISDQINLLSLNAELEAAGSGEAGKRFAVVAGEIKRLASGTLTASEQIRRLISNILESSQAIAAQSSTGAEMIEASTAMAEDVSNAFIQIFQYIQDITVLMKDIASSTGQQQSATELITDNLREMLDSGANFEREYRGMEREIEKLQAAARELKTSMDSHHGKEGI